MCLVLCGATCAQAVGAPSSNGDVLTIIKVDPPNWWAAMPKPMLLVHGEGLDGAKFSLSDGALKIEKVVPSENGHWAQLWLAASPIAAETVTLTAKAGGEKAETRYTFAARRPASDGFAGFSSRDVMYLIMTDRFADGDLQNDGLDAKSAEDSAEAVAERAKARGWHGGDLKGIAQHLEYLQELGVTTVWTTPVYENHEANSYHGYGATNLYRVDEHYGTLEDLKALAAALHARGMKLVLDTVPNHVGPGNPWVKDEPAPDWFHGTAANHLKAETDFQALINPHAPERDKVGTLQGWFANTLPDMNTDSPAVAQYLRQNAVWWIEETGADGLRIDTFPYVNREFWNAFNGELKELFPRLTEVGEVFNGDPVITSSFADGVTRAGMDTKLYTPFDFPTYVALGNVFVKGAPMSELAKVLGEDALYPHPERLVPFIGNHDTERFVTAAGSEGSLKLALAYVLTTRGMAQIYSGDEIAMSGATDPGNRNDFPGGFPGSAENAFVASGRTPVQQETFDWVAKLTAVRRKHDALGCGAEQVLASNDDWMVTLRDAGKAAEGTCGASGERVVVAIHRGGKTGGVAPATLDVKLGMTWMEGCKLGGAEIQSGGATAEVQGGTLHLQAAGDAVWVGSCE
ncbi:MAG TPA: alpha-amylase family glycosyl hydrolase [Acidobacteriaceae bacterium]|nr:alpha-amylase family glycosyl hydrolase [Acidobacteriaceae bacterium]